MSPSRSRNGCLVQLRWFYLRDSPTFLHQTTPKMYDTPTAPDFSASARVKMSWKFAEKSLNFKKSYMNF